MFDDDVGEHWKNEDNEAKTTLCDIVCFSFEEELGLSDLPDEHPILLKFRAFIENLEAVGEHWEKHDYDKIREYGNQLKLKYIM